MFWFLIVFAVEELRDIVKADEYYQEDFIYEEVIEIGGLQNYVRINEVCFGEDSYYLVGGGVRLGDSNGGLDGVVIKYRDEIEWIRSYGGAREDQFLGCFYEDKLYVSGNTLSIDYLGKSSNFRTGFYLTLNEEGEVLDTYTIDYALDIYPEIIWYENGVKVAGYLDDFGDYDLFEYDGSLSITHYSGQDRIYSKLGNQFFGSTTSKELGAMNMNPMIFGAEIEVLYSAYKGELLGSYGYLNDLFFYYDGEINIVEEAPVYQDEVIKVINRDYDFELIKNIPVYREFDSNETYQFLRDNTLYEYAASRVGNVVYYGNVRELYTLVNNIEKDTYYDSFRLLFSGSGLLNGELVESGTLIGVGEYTFSQGKDVYRFEVLQNNYVVQLSETDFLVEIDDIERGINRKFLYIPLIIIGNILYKKYQ